MHGSTIPRSIRAVEAGLVDGYSFEITLKDVPLLRKVAPAVPAASDVSIAFLPGEAIDDRVAAACTVRALGFEPKVHLPARRFESTAQLATLLDRLAAEAGLRKVLVIAGDPERPHGPFADSLALIETGLLEAAGITSVSIAGHPDSHPMMDAHARWQWLERKILAIGARGMQPHIVTQFAFDPDCLLDWVGEMRDRGIDAPVALGIPGPAGIKRLLAFAARCGVGASATVLRKYGISLAQLMGSTGPDRLVGALEAGLEQPGHGHVSLHFYPFGGLGKTIDWIAARGDPVARLARAR